MSEPRTLFLTGATGQIGSALLEELLTGGHTVLALARKPARVAHPESPHLQIVPGDITQERFGLAPERYRHLAATCDSIIHCAASTAFHDRNQALYAANVRGTHEAMAFAVMTRLRRIDYFSTAFVGGADNGTGFRNEYERTKCLAEDAVREALNQGQVVGKIFRPSIVINPSAGRTASPTDGLHRLLALLVRLQQTQPPLAGPIRLSAAPAVRMHFVLLDYVVQASLQLSMTTRGDGAIYSLVDPSPRTSAEIVAMIAEATGIGSIRLADLREVPPDALSAWERCLSDLLALYTGYLFDPTAIDASEFGGVLDPASLPPAGLTTEHLHTMVKNLQESRGQHGISSTRSDRRPPEGLPTPIARTG